MQDSYLYCQNHYEIGNGITFEAKKNSVLKTAFDVTCTHRLKVNFLSASGVSSVKGFLLGPYPYEIAQSKEGPNCILFNELSRRPKTCLGLTIMDYPGCELIHAIVKSNHL